MEHCFLGAAVACVFGNLVLFFDIPNLNGAVIHILCITHIWVWVTYCLNIVLSINIYGSPFLTSKIQKFDTNGKGFRVHSIGGRCAVPAGKSQDRWEFAFYAWYRHWYAVQQFIPCYYIFGYCSKYVCIGCAGG